jgi:putative endonuclease
MLTGMSSDNPRPSERPPAAPARRPVERPREDPRRALGRHGERLAAAHLQRLGLAILARNVRTRDGEIDLIARDGETLVFVEVKTRRSHGQRPAPGERPLEGLRARQRSRLRRLAVAWLQDESREHRTVRALRFDAIGVVVDEADGLIRLDHIAGAW